MNYKFLLESILMNMDEGILVVDSEANVTFYNEPATNIAGISPEKAIGKNILEIFSDLTPESSTFYQVLRNKQPIIDYAQTYMNYQGVKVSTLTSTIPLIEQGEVVGALEIYRDLTQVKELSEKVLNLQSELFRKKSNEKSYSGNGVVYTFDDIIGESLAIKKLKEQAKKIADSMSPVLVYGETGTGKEVLVQAIHSASKVRKHKPFIAQNCAALPNTLLDSILFGTTAGSFTGAKDKPGLFELADGGTLFLDEINSMDLELQGKLLRVLQDGIVRRVGGTNTVHVDVRIIASTNEHPAYIVGKNILRKDLYYRLNVVSLTIPPLRERVEDIPLLVKSFIKMYNNTVNKKVDNITPEAVHVLQSYHWPGNIRELKYAIESIMNFVDSHSIDVHDIPSHIIDFLATPGVKLEETLENIPVSSLVDNLNKYEKQLIQRAIRQANGNGAKAARILNIPRQTLHNKIKKYNIDWKIIMENDV
ncbi:sigma-54 interaction domain-containing protein [Sporomusa sphaeroides]|uniref:sigma-54 interaction domain-containing protein n=1 Tax=Sporomusa sphaeroides TaxID=47679 RepID=UPI002030A015|nr:sigma 54-interacting transcriptional regulator [Sporomusa sphaeroides]MCM0758533.1 sigma 54-interacting transcriptional regulator [Sporomusa sphaeroides DSM 2875]HML33458.1 sigma 54-interacting transcriptional regulator [Sporomusa sphaeroides]